MVPGRLLREGKRSAFEEITTPPASPGCDASPKATSGAFASGKRISQQLSLRCWRAVLAFLVSFTAVAQGSSGRDRLGIRVIRMPPTVPQIAYHHATDIDSRSEEHTSELQSLRHLVC